MDENMHKEILELCSVDSLQKCHVISDMISAPNEIHEYLTVGPTSYYNVIVKFDINASNRYDLITAHHDVVIKGNLNVLDNNASIVNLINICNNIRPNNNLIIAFTDAEEKVSQYLNGARNICQNNDIRYHLDLELTAGGEHRVVKKYGSGFPFIEAHEHNMPFNNASITSDLTSGSACLTIMDGSDLDLLRSGGFPKRWAQCHKRTDGFDWLQQNDCEELQKSIIELFRDLEYEKYTRRTRN
jgi:hypothetical protein